MQVPHQPAVSVGLHRCDGGNGAAQALARACPCCPANSLVPPTVLPLAGSVAPACPCCPARLLVQPTVLALPLPAAWPTRVCAVHLGALSVAQYHGAVVWQVHADHADGGHAAGVIFDDQFVLQAAKRCHITQVGY